MRENPGLDIIYNMKKIKVIEEKKVPGLFGTKTVKKEKYESIYCSTSIF